MRRRIFVAGVAMTRFGRFPERDLADMGAEAVRDSLADAEIDRRSVEVVYAGHARTGRTQSQENGVAQLVLWRAGMGGIPAAGVGNFCASGSTAFREATIAILSGLYDVALAVGVEKLSTREGRGQPLTPDGAGAEVDMGFTPPAYFALTANAYMSETGATAETLAKVAVKNRANAEANPNAHLRSPITVSEVLESPMIASPLTRFQCCPTSDGAAAAVLVSAEAASRLASRERLVEVLATSLTSADFSGPELTRFSIDERAARAAYEMASVAPEDIDCAETHDAFTISEVIHYEDLLFCGRGQGHELVERGETVLTGRIPVSTSGGLLSRGHALGATGIAQVLEVVTQLRGEAGSRQVVGARTGLTHCVGGFIAGEPASSCVHILQRSSGKLPQLNAG